MNRKANDRKVREEGSKKILVNIQILNKKRNEKGKEMRRTGNTTEIESVSTVYVTE